MRTYAREIAKTAVVLMAGLLLASTTPLDASADESEFPLTGGYVGLSVVGALPLFDGPDIVRVDPQGASQEEDTAPGFQARAGWRLHPMIALEAQYEWFEKMDVATKSTTCGEIRSQAITGNARVFLPFDVVHPYVLGGIGAVRHDVQINDTTFPQGNSCTSSPALVSRGVSWEFASRLGAGFDLFLSRHLTLNLEYTVLLNEEETLGSLVPYMSIGAGLQFRF